MFVYTATYKWLSSNFGVQKAICLFGEDLEDPEELKETHESLVSTGNEGAALRAPTKFGPNCLVMHLGKIART